MTFSLVAFSLRECRFSKFHGLLGVHLFNLRSSVDMTERAIFLEMKARGMKATMCRKSTR